MLCSGGVRKSGRWNLANTIDSGGDVAAQKNTLFLLYSVSREQTAHLCVFLPVVWRCRALFECSISGVAVISQGLSTDSAVDPCGVDVWPLSQSVSVLFVAGGQHLSSSHLNQRLTAAIRVLTARQAAQNRGGGNNTNLRLQRKQQSWTLFLDHSEAFLFTNSVGKKKKEGFGHLMHW